MKIPRWRTMLDPRDPDYLAPGDEEPDGDEPDERNPWDTPESIESERYEGTARYRY